CAPSGAPSPSPAASQAAAPQPYASGAAWQAQWDGLVAAAKKEGTLVLITSVGAAYKDAVAAFEKAFPGIQVDHSQQVATLFAPKAIQEGQAGVFLYDVIATSHTTAGPQLYKEGRMDPIRPEI